MKKAHKQIICSNPSNKKKEKRKKKKRKEKEKIELIVLDACPEYTTKQKLVLDYGELCFLICFLITIQTQEAFMDIIAS